MGLRETRSITQLSARSVITASLDEYAQHHGLCYGKMYVRLSVCLSHAVDADIVLSAFHYLITCDCRRDGKILTRLPTTGGYEKFAFSTNISKYLGNDTRAVNMEHQLKIVKAWYSSFISDTFECHFNDTLVKFRQLLNIFGKDEDTQIVLTGDTDGICVQDFYVMLNQKKLIPPQSTG